MLLSKEKSNPSPGKRPVERADNLDASVETITPARAQEYLEKNLNNRTVKPGAVKKYAKDMQEKRWVMTADPIRFNEGGILVDGQHRLLACVDANVSFTTLVVRGLPETAARVMDIGVKRNTATILTGLGFTGNTNQLASTAGHLMTIKIGGVEPRGTRSTQEIIDFIERHPRLPESLGKVFLSGDGTTVRTLPVLGPAPAMLAAMHYIGAVMLDKEERADEFLEVFRTGVPNYNGDPAHLLRERLLRQSSTGLRQSRGDRLRALCGAWNLFSKRVYITKFRSPSDTYIDGLDMDKL